MPRTPFIGVRISWLMLARNCDLVRLAASAVSLGQQQFLRGAFQRGDVVGAAEVSRDPAVGFAQRRDIQENGSPGAVFANVGPLMFIG